MCALYDLHNLAFGLLRLTFREHRHLDLVAVQRLTRVVSSDLDVLAAVFRHHVGLARALHVDDADHIMRLRAVFAHQVGVQSIAIWVMLNELTIAVEGLEHLKYHVFACSVAHTHDLRYLLVVHGLKRMLAVNSQDGVYEGAETVTMFRFFHVVFFLMVIGYWL